MAGILAITVTLVAARPAAAYSVLAHEANVDAVWDSAIQPLLQRAFREPRDSNCSTRGRMRRARYAAALHSVGSGRLNLANTDFDTGRPSAYGEYKLADETYTDLLKKFEQQKAAKPPRELFANIKQFYSHGRAPKKVQKLLARLDETLG